MDTAGTEPSVSVGGTSPTADTAASSVVSDDCATIAPAAEEKEQLLTRESLPDDASWPSLSISSGSLTFAGVDALFDDPETTPYKSKYEARTLLEDGKLLYQQELSKLSSSSSASPALSSSSFSASAALTLILARFDYWLGLNYLDTEEASQGEKLMSSAMAALLPHSASYPLLVVDGHNQLSLLHLSRAHYNRAVHCLLVAQRLYQSLRKRQTDSGQQQPPPAAPCLPAGQWRVLSTLHTLTLYYLAQAYGRLEKRQLSAHCCHLCLYRQLQSDAGLTTAEKADWVRNAVSLAEYYQHKLDWTQAWQCVNGGDAVLRSIDAAELEAEKLSELTADVHNASGLFYLSFMQHSTASPPPAPAAVVPSSSSGKQQLTFTSLSLPPFPYTQPLSAQSLTAVFTAAYRHFQAALQHYSTDGFVSQHIAICQHISSLYRQYGHYPKRRIAVLSPCLDGLNSRHFLTQFRQLHHELAWIYSAMADEQKSLPVKQQAFTVRSLQHHTAFIASYDDKNALTAESGADEQQPYLLSLFATGRLYNKLNVPDSAKMTEYLTQSRGGFQRFMRLCREWGLERSMAAEMSMSEEMLTLLPRRLDLLHRVE